jgi:hypothetical protein
MSRRGVASGLGAIAFVLALLAASVVVTGGYQIALGPLAFSATHASTLFAEAAVAALAALLCQPASPRQQTLGAASLVVLLAALASGSSPRRVGDGDEYLAMATNMAHGRRPSLSATEWRDFNRQVVAWHWSDERPAIPSLVAADGRQDFWHFWIYPLVVAPFVGLCTLLGVNPNHGVTGAQLLMLGGVLLLAARKLGLFVPVLFLAGPLVWYVDKSHAEVFFVCLLLAALLVIDTLPWLSIILTALAAAQNPALIAVFIPVCLVVLATHGLDRRTSMALVAATLAVGVYPLYYWSRIGAWTPLGAVVSLTWPDVTAIVTPLADPNLGLFIAMPVAFAAVAGGAIALVAGNSAPFGRPAHRAAALALPCLLLAVALAGNVNHGATPGPSRYGLWMLPLLVPAIAVALRAVERRPGWRDAMAIVLVLALGWACSSYHPKRREQWSEPTTFARWLWQRHPAVDNPLPEVFAERLSGFDGLVAFPAAIDRCEKVLLARTSSGFSGWPFPCQGIDPPGACFNRQGLCYANQSNGGYGFVAAPMQPGLPVLPGSPWAGHAARDAVRGLEPAMLSLPLIVVRPGRGDSLIRWSDGVSWTYAAQTSDALVVWVVPEAGAAETALQIAVRGPSRLRVATVAGVERLPMRVVGPGIVKVDVSRDEPSIVVLMPS